ncbi:MAG: SGNH/GDSL hydrolase family protein [Planctomycetaceae bacterium]
MFQSLISRIRAFLTAVALLLLAIAVTEVILQVQNSELAPPVSTQTDPNLQSLLAPSATVHHELRRLHQQQFHTAMITTNSLGLRGAEPEIPRPPGTLRILLLGDETVLNPELPDEFCISVRLEQFLRKAGSDRIEVINAGVPGYCPLLSWLQYRHQLRQLQPDVVLLHFDPSDVTDDSYYRRTLTDSGNGQICVHPRLAHTDSGKSSVIHLLQKSAISRLLQRELNLTGDESSGMKPSVRYEWTTAVRTDLRLRIQHAMLPVQRFAEAAQQDGFRLVVSTTPTAWQVARSEFFPRLASEIRLDSAWPVTTDDSFRILDAVCQRSLIPFCNPTAAFREFSQPEKLFAAESCQLSAYGAALYARELARTLLTDPQIAALLNSASEVSAADEVRIR